jgi:hypothetical protein
MQNEMKDFFDKFLVANKNIFKELKDTIKTEEISLIKSMEFLKRNVNMFLNGDSDVANNPDYIKNVNKDK